MKREIVLDIESTIYKINPNVRIGTQFSKKNFLVLGGTLENNTIQHWDRYYVPSNYDSSCLLIGFNIKFDLHWLRRYGTDFSDALLWDCQLAEYLLSSQRWRYPDLDKACDYHGLVGKLNIVDVEYWSKGIDTDQIPLEILTEYLDRDLQSTWELYKLQREIFNNYPTLFKLFRVLCEDLKTLQEIEYNGLKYNTALSLEKAEQTKEEIQKIEEIIKSEWANNIPINLDSPEHISYLLYGGILTSKTQIPIGTYKTGKKAGEVKMKWIEHGIELPKRFEPIKGSKLKKEGIYSTEEFYLTLLLQKTPKRDPRHKLLEILLRKRELTKLTGTYFEGFPKKIQQQDWGKDLIHTSFNMVVTNTGRPSSKGPNIQNLAEGQKECVVSRYAD